VAAARPRLREGAGRLRPLAGRPRPRGGRDPCGPDRPAARAASGRASCGGAARAERQGARRDPRLPGPALGLAAGARGRADGRAPRRARSRRFLRGAYPRPHVGLDSVIVTVTLNAALDRTLTVPNFQRGQRHRASQGLMLAGGKGINIARALKLLGVPVVATGLVGGRTGIRIVEELTSEAILNDFVRIEDESRTSTAVVDPTAPTYTEINEWGPAVRPEELEMLLDKLAYLAQGADAVVFAGSLPRDVDEAFYGEAIREVNRRGVTTVLDSEGQPLRLGVQSEPFLVSPNQNEAEG